MKKISSKKLQLRSSMIANLSGPDLRIVQGGTDVDLGGGGGGGGVGGTDGAGVRSLMDDNGHPLPCNFPITTTG
jgi:hypothetical protein